MVVPTKNKIARAGPHDDECRLMPHAGFGPMP
jgi:hypothetical protein